MKEIKFRAWNSNTKQMIPVTFTAVCSADSIIGLYKSDGKNIFDVWGLPAWKYITIMQYTGLKDKHGTEIYEGDIVKTSYGDSVTVIWDNDEALKDGTDEWCVGFRLPSFAEDCDVIGNIYENHQENTDA